MLENAAESPASGARCVGRILNADRLNTLLPNRLNGCSYGNASIVK
jgi:hypothetical protein